jgi:hypothetical protein
MNYTTEGCISRGFVALVGTLVLIMITCANYRGLSGQDTLIAACLYAVALYGLLPVQLSHWLFAFACIAGICAVIICAPQIAVAIAAVVACIAILCK